MAVLHSDERVGKDNEPCNGRNGLLSAKPARTQNKASMGHNTGSTVSTCTHWHCCTIASTGPSPRGCVRHHASAAESRSLVVETSRENCRVRALGATSPLDLAHMHPCLPSGPRGPRPFGFAFSSTQRRSAARGARGGASICQRRICTKRDLR